MKTKIEIINETVAYYSEDPFRRALEGNACCYRTTDGRKCAVGRCMTRPTVGMYGPVGSLQQGAKRDIDLDSRLRPEYQGHSLSFWYDLQSFHDQNNNWTGKGLSRQGKAEAKKLLKNYANQ